MITATYHVEFPSLLSAIVDQSVYQKAGSGFEVERTRRKTPVTKWEVGLQVYKAPLEVGMVAARAQDQEMCAVLHHY